jgi:hypothetical protein
MNNVSINQMPYLVQNTFGFAKQWKRIKHKQSARWQNLFWLNGFLFDIFLLGVKKHTNLYLRLVMASSG